MMHFKTTIGELFKFYLEHEEETFVCGTVLHMFDPGLNRVGVNGGVNFTIDVIYVFSKHFNKFVSENWLGRGNTFEWYISEDYYNIKNESTREVRIALMTDIVNAYGPDVELEFTITENKEYLEFTITENKEQYE